MTPPTSGGSVVADPGRCDPGHHRSGRRRARRHRTHGHAAPHPSGPARHRLRRLLVAAQQAVNGRLHVWTSPTKHVGSDHRVTYDAQDGADPRDVVPGGGAVGGQHRCGLQHGHAVRRPRRRLARDAVPRHATAATPRGAGPVRRWTPPGSTSTSRGWRVGRWTADRRSLPLAYRHAHDVELEADGVDLQGDDRQPGRLLVHPAVRAGCPSTVQDRRQAHDLVSSSRSGRPW